MQLSPDVLTACAAAMAVLDEMHDHALQEQSLHVGTRLRTMLDNLRRDHRCIRSVRGEGLYIAVEIEDVKHVIHDAENDANGKSKYQSATALAALICESMKAHGVLHGRVGRNDNVLKIRPPLVFNDQHATMLTDTLDIVLCELNE